MTGTRPSPSNFTAATKSSRESVPVTTQPSRRGLHARESGIDVGDEIVGILEPGMEAHERPFVLEALRGALEVAGDRQALVSAPGIAQPEMMEAVEEGGHRGLLHRLEFDAEQSG